MVREKGFPTEVQTPKPLLNAGAIQDTTAANITNLRRASVLFIGGATVTIVVAARGRISITAANIAVNGPRLLSDYPHQPKHLTPVGSHVIINSSVINRLS